MKRVIKMHAIGLDDDVKVTREGMDQWKRKLENAFHAALIGDGFAPSDIRFKK